MDTIILKKRADKYPSKIIVIDMETSGLSPAGGDRVIECAAVKIQHDRIVSELSTLINAPCKIHREAVKVHEITSEMLKGQPDPNQAWASFLNFIGDAPLIAHNAKFDIGFIRMELSLLGKRLTNKSICTLLLARKRFPHLDNYRLETVARYLLGDIPIDCQLHRALGDARLVAYIWMAMEEKH